MSFWENVKKFAQPYGDDEYDEYEDGEEGFEDEEILAPRSRRNDNNAEAAAPAAERSEGTGFSGKVLNMNSNKPSVVLFRPTNFNEATKAADDLREKKAVIVNLENVEPGIARRVVDFLSGCAYAVDGKVKKVAQSTYLFCPHNMDIVGELENMQAEVESYT